ncbi:MAG: 2-dehydro-3-deoxyphosphogluconate aldolase / (4S)-4-hydroxy-2-oxoglutarate aldolase [Gaiellaceae bacterium]|nr:2-dehydro-3-deoxyphosphogluconate aldolase / (4S)-4-hydroxy-2-oxoglutarate aldolase [Gaiellaceae bacterium]MDX6469032.1 2-dehydro-3-deoxyphosphogluconate aldolase / (4S)-4-hydroxy-2-oxoglutarate aldolase [Gaiellaceae bacterium]MDX6474169.1 2-dehydro-3-deoxyphosphogluconate aldolase / (4S)-4-hydroxy-2-oxoglutarate aldolase [Gaiellaceae bacterium]
MTAPFPDAGGILDALDDAPVIAVVVIDDAADAVPLANALASGGVRAIEVTLRTPAALDAIERIVGNVEGMKVAAGTVTRPEDVARVSELGVDFAVSPGFTATLAAAAARAGLPLLPGVATPSETMLGREHGVRTFKFFPAESLGGAKMLAAWGELFPDVRFCPSGGIDPGNAAGYLELPNVPAVGGSWLAPRELIRDRGWQQIEQRAAAAARRVTAA